MSAQMQANATTTGTKADEPLLPDEEESEVDASAPDAAALGASQ